MLSFLKKLFLGDESKHEMTEQEKYIEKVNREYALKTAQEQNKEASSNHNNNISNDHEDEKENDNYWYSVIGVKDDDSGELAYFLYNDCDIHYGDRVVVEINGKRCVLDIETKKVCTRYMLDKPPSSYSPVIKKISKYSDYDDDDYDDDDYDDDDYDDNDYDDNDYDSDDDDDCQEADDDKDSVFDWLSSDKKKSSSWQEEHEKRERYWEWKREEDSYSKSVNGEEDESLGNYTKW